MNSAKEIEKIAKKTLEIEASSIAGLIYHINDDFVKTIIRYDQTVNVEAQIFEGDSTR